MIGAPSVLVGDIKSALAELQPALDIVSFGAPMVIEGTFYINSSDGPVDSYQVRIELKKGFPNFEPLVFETAGRIPKISGRHINLGGDCCITVWEAWLATAAELTFRAFLCGPMHEYFLNQYFFEKTGEWRLGERSHGTKGLVEAFSEVLGVDADRAIVVRYLRSLAIKPKGHLPCPCGSGKILRSCHRNELHKLYADVGPDLASRMLKRLGSMPAA